MRGSFRDGLATRERRRSRDRMRLVRYEREPTIMNNTLFVRRRFSPRAPVLLGEILSTEGTERHGKGRVGLPRRPAPRVQDPPRD